MRNFPSLALEASKQLVLYLQTPVATSFREQQKRLCLYLDTLTSRKFYLAAAAVIWN